MNILSLLLGHFNNTQPFYLYRIENSSILLFKLTDVCSFFNLPSTALESQSEPIYRDKQQQSDIYLTTTVLASLAIKHNKFLLAELCKLKPNDYAANLAESILSNLPRLECNKARKDASQYKVTEIELYESTPQDELAVKSEPVSPPPMSTIHRQHLQSDPMAIDTMLTHGAGSQQQQQTRRLSRTFEDQPNKKQKKNDSTVVNILPKPIHTVSSQHAPPTLLAKRLKQNVSTGKNTRNLTIYAPSYGEQFSAGIRSAPLNSNFRHQQQPNNNNSNNNNNKTQPHPLSQTISRSPATSTTTEFAIPPIVPSQQQPPHTAHPSSMHHHFPPHSPQYPSSAYGHSFPVTSGRVIVESSLPTTAAAAPLPPKTPTTNSHAALQRQQFMQPFEHLFDTIETTRTLKSTLDDQIRRSSTLMQTLQASSTTIEGLVRNQIKEVQKEILHRMEDSLENLFKRITVLERRSNIEVEVESTTMEEQPTRKQQQQQQQQQQQRELVNPPTIVKSQNDIGPNEYHVMLDTLRERLDRLERQLES